MNLGWEIRRDGERRSSIPSKEEKWREKEHSGSAERTGRVELRLCTCRFFLDYKIK